MPKGTATQKAREIAITASSMVTRNLSFNWSHTGVLYHRDVPRSPRSTFHSQLPYWTYIGRSRPSACRNCCSCSWETDPLSPSPPARIVRAGSPGTIQKSVNTRTVATSSVGIKSSTLRMAYSPIPLSRMQDWSSDRDESQPLAERVTKKPQVSHPPFVKWGRGGISESSLASSHSRGSGASGSHQICSKCFTICSEPGTWKFCSR